jgi:hypothetical protein
MHRFINILLFLLAGSLSCNALALDDIGQAEQPDDETTSAATAEIRPKSTNSIILETYNVYGSVGTIGTKTKIPGPMTQATIRQYGTPLYEEAGYGLYNYLQYKAQVWYQGNLATVIILMAYPNAK